MANDITFELPFRGTWLTFWGGDTKELNHHHQVLCQRHAFDFIAVDENGAFVKDKKGLKGSYYSYSQAVYAPADGEVVEVVDGLRDNEVGYLNSFQYFGNYIMIKHAADLFSVLGHLKNGSKKVILGQTVKQGEEIAACGNSGHTTDPHIHFHVQDSAEFAKVDESYKMVDVAIGKKVYFKSVAIKTGDTVITKANYSPIKDDIIIT